MIELFFFYCAGESELHSSALVSVDPVRGTLKVLRAQDADAGDYTCVALNPAGTDQAHITLDVGCESTTHADTKTHADARTHAHTHDQTHTVIIIRTACTAHSYIQAERHKY